jgi:RNA polymerase sigma-70 factor (ECF subfamily)
MTEPFENPPSPPSPGSDADELSPETVNQLFREHNRALVGYLTARLRSENEAKEVAQEAYVRLLQLHKAGTPSLFRAYLFKTATNLAIDRLRRRTVQKGVDLFEELAADRGEAENPERQVIAQELSSRLQASLRELPEKCFDTFRLHRLEGLDQNQVGQRLGISARMVRRYITYAIVYCRLRVDGVSAERARKLVTL